MTKYLIYDKTSEKKYILQTDLNWCCKEKYMEISLENCATFQFVLLLYFTFKPI